MFAIINGEPILNAEGLSLLIDVPVVEIEAEAARQGVSVTAMDLPRAWDLRGQGIASRLAARGVRGDVAAALDILAAERDQQSTAAPPPR